MSTLIKKQLHKFGESDKEKAILHTWLAWQKEPWLSLSQAVTARFKKQFILDDKKANDFITWLQKLFKYSLTPGPSQSPTPLTNF